MNRFDLVIRGGTVATAADTFRADVGIRDGRIAALAQDLDGADDEIDASGKLVLPGGIDSHCHIEQMSAAGVLCADDFYSGSASAAFGGTTTIIPFAAQHRGQSLREVVGAYHDCAGPKAVVDYAFHLIISDPTAQIVGQELPALIEDGYTSFKVYMTYDLLKLDDYQMLDVLSLARREGAMTMVHAENHDLMIASSSPSWVVIFSTSTALVAPRWPISVAPSFPYRRVMLRQVRRSIVAHAAVAGSAVMSS